MNVLRLDGVTISRGDRLIVRDVTFSLAEGEVLALEGQNGSGKTSLLLALAGHPAVQATQGVMAFAGSDLASLSPVERVKRGVLYLFQDPPSLAGVKVIDFLRLAMSSRFGEMSYADVFARVRAALPTVGFSEEVLHRSVHDKFSGGEKKRLELLMMLLLEPKLLLVDEIDAGLDAAMRDVAASLLRAQAEKGTAMIVTSHQASFLAQLPVTASLYVQDGTVAAPPCVPN